MHAMRSLWPVWLRPTYVAIILLYYRIKGASNWGHRLGRRSTPIKVFFDKSLTIVVKLASTATSERSHGMTVMSGLKLEPLISATRQGCPCLLCRLVGGTSVIG